MNQDVRWKQRFSNFDKSRANHREALETANPNKLERQGIIHDGESWAQMHQARNESAHVYNEDDARVLEAKIRRTYTPLLARLGEDLRDKR